MLLRRARHRNRQAPSSPDALKTDEERPQTPPCVIEEFTSSCSQNDGDGAAPPPKRTRHVLEQSQNNNTQNTPKSYGGNTYDEEALNRDFDRKNVQNFVPIRGIDGDKREYVILDPRAEVPTVRASDAAYVEACTGKEAGGGLRFRIDEDNPSNQYLLKVVDDTGADGIVHSALKAGDESATSTMADLLRGGFEAEELDRPCVLIPTSHHGETIAQTTGRTYRLFDEATDGLKGYTIDTGVVRRCRVLDKAPKALDKRRNHHKDTVVVDDDALKAHVGKILRVVDDDTWTGSTLEAVVVALRAAIKRLKLDIVVQTLVLAKLVHPNRTQATLEELALPVREKLRAASERFLSQGDVSTVEAEHVGIIYCIEIGGITYTFRYDIYEGSNMPSVEVSA
jgi:hypothetical protein